MLPPEKGPGGVGGRNPPRAGAPRKRQECSQDAPNDPRVIHKKLLNDFMDPSLVYLYLTFSVRSKITQITFVRFDVEMHCVFMFFQIII